jgi:hypothetical protein
MKVNPAVFVKAAQMIFEFEHPLSCCAISYAQAVIEGTEDLWAYDSDDLYVRLFAKFCQVDEVQFDMFDGCVPDSPGHEQRIIALLFCAEYYRTDDIDL